MPFFGVCQLRDPLTNFQKIGTVDYVGDPNPHASFGVNRFKGVVSAHAWNCHPQASIFFFLFLISCASLQVGLLDRSPPLTAQTTQPVGVHIPYMVSIIKINIFPIFYPKMWKIALRPMANSNRAITRERLKIDASCFHQTGGFRGRAIESWNGVIQIYPQTDLCCHGNRS